LAPASEPRAKFAERIDIATSNSEPRREVATSARRVSTSNGMNFTRVSLQASGWAARGERRPHSAYPLKAEATAMDSRLRQCAM
jgi:hypothetical protein